MTRSNIITTLEEAKAALEEASQLVGASSKLSHKERLEILATVYRIQLDGSEREALMDFVIENRKLEGANRAFVMKRTNAYALPLRYIFPSIKDSNNVSRYSGALDQACRLGIPPHSFKEGVKEHGGLMQLYWLSRDRVTRRQKRQTLTLDRPIEAVDGLEIHLVLVPDKRMIFEVQSYRLVEPKASAA